MVRVAAFLFCELYDGACRGTYCENIDDPFNGSASGRQDLNLRTSGSRTERSTKLSYAPTGADRLSFERCSGASLRCTVRPGDSRTRIQNIGPHLTQV